MMTVCGALLWQVNHGTIPYLGTFLTDLMYIHAGIPDYTADGLINFDKRRKEFEILAQVSANFEILAQVTAKFERFVQIRAKFEILAQVIAKGRQLNRMSFVITSVESVRASVRKSSCPRLRLMSVLY